LETFMTIAESLLPEFDREMATTRKVLECVPEAQAAWKPHPKSTPLGGLAAHLANLPGFAIMALNQTEFDFNPPDGSGIAPPRFESTDAALTTFDDNVAKARAALASASDADIMTMWALKNAGNEIFSMPRLAVLRTAVLSHVIHHRGQMSVYLRLLDVPVPQVYGPTADFPM
jgi:uncharacterized damage-inducible protein DinB